MMDFKFSFPLLSILGRYFIALVFLISLLFYPGQNFYQTFYIPSNSQNSFYLPQLKPTSSRPISRHLPKPKFTAKAIVVQDINSKAMLFLKNPNTRLYPASTTKIMTALVSLDAYSNLNQVVTITNEYLARGHKIGLQPNERITIKALLQGLLISSGNDAALALAQNYPSGYAGFVQAMNQKAIALGLTRTHFTNPSGVEEKDHYTSARDLAVLATIALSNDFIRQTVQTQTLTITDISGHIKHVLINTNKLLGKVSGVQGLKTGWTPQAGECLVTYVNRYNHPLIIVLLGSQDRFGETTTLINWIYQNYYWYN